MDANQHEAGPHPKDRKSEHTGVGGLAAAHSPPGSEFRKHWGLWTARSCLTIRHESNGNAGKAIAANCVHFNQIIHWLLGLVA